jgi:hypothetical protein
MFIVLQITLAFYSLGLAVIAESYFAEESERHAQLLVKVLFTSPSSHNISPITMSLPILVYL